MSASSIRTYLDGARVYVCTDVSLRPAEDPFSSVLPLDELGEPAFWVWDTPIISHEGVDASDLLAAHIDVLHQVLSGAIKLTRVEPDRGLSEFSPVAREVRRVS